MESLPLCSNSSCTAGNDFFFFSFQFNNVLVIYTNSTPVSFFFFICVIVIPTSVEPGAFFPLLSLMSPLTVLSFPKTSVFY